MARIRTVKPQYWAHETLSKLSPLAHMLGAALLNPADDEGYFLANPGLVKAATFPVREDFDADVAGRCLDELARVEYVRLGTLPDGRRVGQVTTFLNHQRVDKPTPSRLGKLPIQWDDDSATTRRGLDEPSPKPRASGAEVALPLDEDSSLEGKGRGREEEEDPEGSAAPAREPLADDSTNPRRTLDEPSPTPARAELDPRRRSHALAGGAASPRAWGIAHGGHEPGGFCGWMCFPTELAEQFTTGLVSAGQAPNIAAARADVETWAHSVRHGWEHDGRVPTGRMFDFWRDRWAERHGGVSGVGRGSAGPVDVLAGLREPIAVGGDS